MLSPAKFSKAEGNRCCYYLCEQGAGPDYYTFSLSENTHLPFINAIGSTPTLSYHKVKTASSLLLFPANATEAACVCAVKPAAFGHAKGSLQYENTTVPLLASSVTY